MRQKDNLKKGQVIERLPSTMFKVVLEDGREVLAHLAGKLRIHYIKILPGDFVLMEFSPYDENKGRITQRL